IPGELAFKLYDTYGLSVDIVADVAKESDLNIDMTAYERAMDGQRAKSQESWKGSGEEEMPEAYRKLIAKGLSSQFLGYETLSSGSKVMALLVAGKELSSAQAGDEVEILLDRTPFYGEAGGQVGDTGRLICDGMKVHVRDTLKFAQNFIVHQGVVKEGTISLGDKVEAEVDKEKRNATARNHSATHLLHAALREVLGDYVKQAGSLVSPERLRFDFSHFTQVDKERLKQVEALVNWHIRENLSLSTKEMSRDEAMKTGARAIFEERYCESVRLVQVGDGISMELCGGTHTARTGDIGLFKIMSESAVGANLRRVEALAGEAAVEYVQGRDDELHTVALLMKSAPDQVSEKVERLLKEQKEKEREIESLKAKLLSTKSGDWLSGEKEIRGIKVLVKELEVDSPKALREFADRIKERLRSGIIVLGARKADKAMLICMVSKDLIGRFKAGQIISQLSEIVGGKGGGRADMAQGGGSRPYKLGLALESVYELIENESE
ncbi:MAG: alanine--tRNA ligase-related protein, partial [Desulfatiglandales bacterium]|nr:alanine--tRNA ligase-related protein [Desulfatiglandales bacterium]